MRPHWARLLVQGGGKGRLPSPVPTPLVVPSQEEKEHRVEEWSSLDICSMRKKQVKRPSNMFSPENKQILKSTQKNPSPVTCHTKDVMCKPCAVHAPVADALKASGKVPEGGRKATLLQKSKDGSGTVKGDLQSTLLEGHGTAPPDLDLSAINDRSVVRRIPQLEKTVAKKTESTSFIAPRKKSPDPTEVMEMMESQTLLLSLLTLKMENSLAEFEEEAEKNLVLVCREAAALQEQAHGLRRRLLLCQRTRELAETLDAQMELLSPFEAVCERFKEQYRTFATALDTTRHELPLKSIHLEGDGHQLLDALQRDLETTHRLLGELGMGSAEENEQVLALLQELRDATSSKDLELQRIFSQVLELSAEASKEAALINQEVWEEAQGLGTPSQWYFNADGTFGIPRGEPRSTVLSGDNKPHAQ
ncbi:HAUS augmin-like complex subunit 8 isoform X2 [Marmota monax]|uniref:HAUS augmin-like complex subunit 8 isoform X2 n=1 Tax=Marmota monax TaxID=9995 RepID=UPI0026EA0B25|nr:HAUS augmin-like complex subunit 8 isoform X2 [Marmota monax]